MLQHTFSAPFQLENADRMLFRMSKPLLSASDTASLLTCLFVTDEHVGNMSPISWPITIPQCPLPMNYKICLESKTKIFKPSIRPKTRRLGAVRVMRASATEFHGSELSLSPCNARIACEVDTCLKVSFGFQNAEECRAVIRHKVLWKTKQIGY